MRISADSRLHRVLYAWPRYKRSRGFGVHSPFAFSFIRGTLCEKLPYYSYSELADSRRRAHAEAADGQIVPSLADLKLLVRLMCRFRPLRVLVMGCDSALVGQALTAVEHDVAVYGNAADYFDACGDEVPFVLLCGGCSGVLEAAESAVCRGGVIAVCNLDRDAAMSELLGTLRAKMTAGMIFSNGKTAVAVAYRHLPRQDFNLWF